MKRLAVSISTAIALVVLPYGLPVLLAHPPARTVKAPVTADRKELPILQKWSGDFPLAELQRLPADQRNVRTGYIGDPRTFASVWEAFKPGEAPPAVDFSRQLVIFSRNTTFYNRMNIGRVTLHQGVAEPLFMETMSAMPLEEKAAMALAVVPRDGVVSIKGNASPVPAGQVVDDIQPVSAERFVRELKLADGKVAIIAEGDREPRSIGSYSVRIYADLFTGSYIAGTIRPRNGFIRDVRVEDRDQAGRVGIAVVIETAGSGRYISTDVLTFDGRNLSMDGQEPRRQQ